MNVSVTNVFIYQRPFSFGKRENGRERNGRENEREGEIKKTFIPDSHFPLDRFTTHSLSFHILHHFVPLFLFAVVLSQNQIEQEIFESSKVLLWLRDEENTKVRSESGRERERVNEEAEGKKKRERNGMNCKISEGNQANQNQRVFCWIEKGKGNRIQTRPKLISR